MVDGEAASPSSGAGVTILVVDDEADILQAISAVLEAYLPGNTVLTAGSGSAALEILNRTNVHVILSDYRMPEMDGLEFLTRSQEVAPNAVCIMVTAYPDLEIAVRALNENHVLNFLVKPVQADKLVDVVSAAIAVRTDALGKARAVAAAIQEVRRVKAEQSN